MIRATVVVEDAAGQRVLDLDIPQDAPFGEVCEAAGGRQAWLDGHQIDRDERCGDLAWPRGATLGEPARPDRLDRVTPGALEWVTGPDVGTPAAGPRDCTHPFVRIGAHWAVRRGAIPSWAAATIAPGRTTTPVNRGLPRPTPPPPEPVEVPAPEPPPPPPQPPGWATTVLPIVVGLVLAVVVAPMMALFALLSPTVAVATWIDERRRRRRHVREAAERWRREAQQFRRDLRGARQRALRHVWSSVTLPGDLLRALVRGSGRLWQSDVPIEVMVGVGAGTLDLPVTDAAPVPDLASYVQAARTAVVPLTVPLEVGVVVGICGPARDDCARAIVLQAAALVGPADLAVVTPWSWSRWLPHADADGDASMTLMVTTDQVRDHTDGRCTVVLAADPEGLPPEVTTVVVATPTRLEVTHRGVVRGHGSPILIDPRRAADVARAAARWEDPRGTRATPHRGLLDLDPATDALGQLPVTLGIGADGPVTVDLVDHGPHALVAGTTGSGKSELLRTLVATAAAAVAPDRLAFLLLDFKGGATFDPVACLPHVVGVVTDLDGVDAARTLRVLRAEVTRREQVLGDCGVADLADLADGVLPRLVVVADEVAALVRTQSDAAEVLTDIAQRGRSLGMHLVLATQRPRGVIGDALRANLALRICLRTESDEDALDVVGSRVPATFPKQDAGRAVVAGSMAATIQVPDGSRRRSDRVRIRAIDGLPVAAGREEPTELQRLVAACREHWGDRQPLLAMPDPLPDHPDLDVLPTARDGVVIGLVDRPDDLRVDPLVWDTAGHLLLHTRDPATTNALVATVALQIAARPPSEIHLYAVAAGSVDLRALAALPHTAAVVDATDRTGLRRLVRRLQDPPGRCSVLVVPAWDHLDRLLDDASGFDLRERLHAVVEHGPAHGLTLVAGTVRPGAAPAALVAGSTLRLVGTLGDDNDHLLLGRRDPMPARPGRVYVAGSGADAQLATVRDVTRRVTERRDAWVGHPGPEPLPQTPQPWQVDDLPPVRKTRSGVAIPVGRSLLDAEPAMLPLVGGEHVLVAGPRGSGRTSFLRSLLDRLTSAADVTVVTPSPDAWPCPTLHPEDLPQEPPTAIVLVDDGDLVPAATPLDRWTDDPSVTIVAAQMSSRLRATSAAWLLRVRLGRTGVLLAPVAERDAMHLDVLSNGPMPTEPGLALVVVDGRADTVAIPVVPTLDGAAQTIAAEEIVGFARTKSTIRCT